MAAEQPQDKYVLRFPDGMRDRLKASAKEQGRSLNSEIVSKLQRYDSLAGEVDAIWEVARALASAIDEATAGKTIFGPLLDEINDAFDAVGEDGAFDRAALFREYVAKAGVRIEDITRSGATLPDELRDRIATAAVANHRTIDAEIVARLEASFAADEVNNLTKLNQILRDIERRKNDPFRPPGFHTAQGKIMLEMARTAAKYDAQQEAGEVPPPTRFPTQGEWYLMRPAIAAKDEGVLNALYAINADLALRLAIEFNEQMGYLDGDGEE